MHDGRKHPGFSKVSSGYEGLATRTPIRFGFAVEGAFLNYQTSYQQMRSLATERFLLYLYRSRMSEEWYSFILVQGARFAGKFTVEVGICARENYPYYYASRTPFLGIDGLRERLGGIHENTDTWWTYRSQEQLQNHVHEILRDSVGRAFYILIDTYQRVLRKEITAAKALYEEWLALEKKIKKKTLGNRFRGLAFEQEAFDYINQGVNHGLYDKVLGPLKVRYKDLHFFSFQNFAMAKLMEDDNSARVSQGISKLDVADDEIGQLIGRMPLDSYLRLPDGMEERVRQYAFLKSLAVAEALYTGDEF